MKQFLSLVFITMLVVKLNAQCTPEVYNDPENRKQYDLMNIPCAWSITDGDPNIVVTAFDRYFDNAHPELVGKVVDIIGNCDETGVTYAEYTHGNQSLGAVAAVRNNNVCIAGSGGDTKVMGYCGGATNGALETAANTHGSQILAVSAWYEGSMTKSKLEELTFDGTVILLAGLSNYHQASNPQGIHSVPGVIHVGRAYMDGSFWQYGVNPQNNLDVLVITDSLYRIGEGASCELSGAGTSIGTPTLAGVVALMMAVNSCISPADIEEILVQTAAPSPNSATRSGVINAYEAVLMAQNFSGIDRSLSGVQSIDYFQVSGNLTIEEDAEITINQKFKSGNNSEIIVEAGAKLIFNTGSLAFFGENAKIIVKRGGHLVVDGAKLTTGGCTEGGKWRGIVVEGNSNSNQQLLGNTMYDNLNGIVEIKNGSIIENAKTAVSMNAGHIVWPDVQSYRGGLVYASNSTFLNNDRAFEFMQYFRQENSQVIGCVFDGHKTVATHWSNFGATYLSNTFLNYEKNALLSYDAQFNVLDGNTFDGDGHTQYDEAAVDMYYTYPNSLIAVQSGSKIGDLGSEPNYFYGDYHGVFCEGCAPTLETEVVNNIFSGNWRGITFHGIGNHIIQHNDVIGHLVGSQIADNGSLGNIMSQNNFSGNDVGNYAYRENSGFEFLDNCYDFQYTRDVRLHDADLNDDIGSSDKAAGNVFSYPYTTLSIGITGGTQISNYHLPKSLESNPSQSRLVPRNYPGNLWNAPDIIINPMCGSELSPGPTRIKKRICSIPGTCEEIKIFISQKETELAYAQANLASSTYQSQQWYQYRYDVSLIKRCLQQAKLKLIWACRPRINYDEYEGRFANDEFIYKTYLYGLMVDNQDYPKARNYLNSMVAVSEEEIDFKTIQNINLDRLQVEKYTASSQTLNTVRAIGEKSRPMSGYARSLYKVLTETKLELQIPAFEEINLEDRSNSNLNKSIFVLSPNPAVDQISIYFAHDEHLTASVMSVEGKVYKTFDLLELTGKKSFDISELNSGVYIVLLRSKSGEIVFKEKLIKH